MGQAAAVRLLLADLVVVRFDFVVALLPAVFAAVLLVGLVLLADFVLLAGLALPGCFGLDRFVAVLLVVIRLVPSTSQRCVCSGAARPAAGRCDRVGARARGPGRRAQAPGAGPGP